MSDCPPGCHVNFNMFYACVGHLPLCTPPKIELPREGSLVSFETRNLCTFLLGLFRFIISSLVNDYYLISSYFNQFHLSTCTRYCISYFITISCCLRHQFSLLFMYDPLSAIHLQSLGARPK